MEIVYLFIGIVIGGIIGYMLIARRTTILQANNDLQQKHFDSLRLADVESYNKLLATKKEELDKYDKENETLRQENVVLREQKISAFSEISVLKEKLETQKQEIIELHKQMTTEFENIATKILKENSSEFKEKSVEQLKNLLEPFGLNIKGMIDPLGKDIHQFREKVETFYGDEAKQRFSLQESIKNLVEANQRISEDANNLTKALKGESKVQGDWGEMILETILEKSGLKKGEQYDIQEFIKDDNGDIVRGEGGHKMQPDIVVYFPDDRRLIIDSKVSLTAYVDYIGAEDDEIAEQKKKELYASVKSHIDELSKKDYSKYMDNAPDFVMMFIPNEAAYYMAIQMDSNLWNYAYSKQVVMMTPTNLITALKLTLDLWRRDAREKNFEVILQKAGAMYDKFAGFVDTLKDVGARLDGLNTSYQKAMGQLSTGNGNLVKRAFELNKMGINSKKRLSIESTDSEDNGEDHLE